MSLWTYQSCIYNVLNIGQSVSAQLLDYFSLIAGAEWELKQRERSEGMITFGLNTAVSDFMAHQEGVVWR